MTSAVDPADFGGNVVVQSQAETRRLPGILVAAVSSIGAGAVHAAATGIHAEHPQLARIFVVTAILQLGMGLLALVRPSRLVAAGVAVVNITAVTGWIVTRVSGISWIDGLEVKESAQFADSTCALMGAVAIGAAVVALAAGWRTMRPGRLLFPGLAVLALTVPAMMSGGTHLHSDGHGAGTESAAHDDDH